MSRTRLLATSAEHLALLMSILPMVLMAWLRPCAVAKALFALPQLLGSLRFPRALLSRPRRRPLAAELTRTCLHSRSRLPRAASMPIATARLAASPPTAYRPPAPTLPTPQPCRSTPARVVPSRVLLGIAGPRLAAVLARLPSLASLPLRSCKDSGCASAALRSPRSLTRPKI